jgi:hypothetical protein
VTSFCCVLFITYEFNDWRGAYAAFGQNLMMFILFIDMLLTRNNLLGQSIFIALFKMIGTRMKVYENAVFKGLFCTTFSRKYFFNSYSYYGSKNKLTAIHLMQSLILLLARTPELALQERSVYGSEFFSNYDSKHSDLSLNCLGLKPLLRTFTTYQNLMT